MVLSRDENAVVDREVRDLLGRSRAFQRLSPRDREQLVDRTSRIASRLVANELGAPVTRTPTTRTPATRTVTGRALPRIHDDPYALAFADPDSPPVPGGSATPAGTPPDDRWRPDERFRAEGIAAGVTQASRMVNEVNFPAFVASLVKGTFQAVVDASIQQMQAYGTLVQSVAQSLNDFADANVSEDDGQKKLMSKYPNVFEMSPDTKKLAVKDDFDSDAMPDFAAELGLGEPVTDLDEDSLPKLVTAAKLEIARGRQQLLATTILMGINRIIITDGKINAKIKFDFNATDSMMRRGEVKDVDMSHKKVQDYSLGRGFLTGHYEEPVPITVSSTKADSTANIDAHAKLTGEVSLNFRSETFPLERMMSSDQMFQINQAQSGARGVPAPPPSAPSQTASPAGAVPKGP